MLGWSYQLRSNIPICFFSVYRVWRYVFREEALHRSNLFINWQNKCTTQMDRRRVQLKLKTHARFHEIDRQYILDDKLLIFMYLCLHYRNCPLWHPGHEEEIDHEHLILYILWWITVFVRVSHTAKNYVFLILPI